MGARALAVLGLTLLAAWSNRPEVSASGDGELIGCLEQATLQSHVMELMAADWRTLDRGWLARRWPDQLKAEGRESGSNEVIGLELPGRVIGREIQCGMSYLFDREPGSAGARAGGSEGDSYRLRSVSLWHAEPTLERALEFERWLIRTTGAPETSRGRWSVTFDSEDERRVVDRAEYAWTSGNGREWFLVSVIEGNRALVVAANWARSTN